MSYFYATNCDGVIDNNVADDELGTGVVKSSTGTITYSANKLISPTTSIFCDPTTASGFMRFTFATAPSEVYSRMYLYMDTLPASGNVVFAKLRVSGTDTTVAQLSISPTGKIRASNGLINAFTGTVDYRFQWIRVEWRAKPGFDQEIRVYSGANLHGTVVTETSGAVGCDAQITVNDFNFGGVNSIATNFYMDDLAAADSSTGWIGPYVAPPNADFLMSPNTADVFVPIQFQDLSTSATQWAWSFGDGFTSTEENPIHAYTSEGTYQVTLVATNAGGDDTAQQQLVITAATQTILYSTSWENGAEGDQVTALSEGLSRVTGTGSAIYTAARAITGNKSLLVSTDVAIRAELDVSPSQPQVCIRQYVQFTKFPSTGNVVIAAFRNAGVAFACLAIDNQGVPQIRKTGTVGDILVRGSEPIPLNQWTRFEIRVKSDSIAVRGWPGATRHATDLPPIRINYVPPASSPQPNTDEVRFLCTAADEGGIYYCEDVAVQLDWVGPVAGVTEGLGAAFTSAFTAKTNVSMDFTDRSSGVPVTWDWDWGDGSAHGTTQNPSHTFTTYGEKTVTLTVKDATGNSKAISKVITVLDTTGTAAPVKVRIGGVWKTGAKIHTEDGSIGRARVYKSGKWTGNASGTGPQTRFPGDPGNSKCYIGVFSKDGNDARWDYEFAYHTGRLSAVTPPGGVMQDRAPAMYRIYGDYNNFSSSALDSALSRKQVPYVTYKFANPAQMQSCAQGNEDATFITDCANYFKAHQNRFFWVGLHHEPDQNGSFMYSSPRPNKTDYTTAPNRDRRMWYRRANRHFIQKLKALGVTNIAHVACTYMCFTFLPGTLNPWWEWYPDWKGDSTYPTDASLDDRTGVTAGAAPGYQGTFYAPNPADFWLSGANSVADINGIDSYCVHSQGGFGVGDAANNIWKWSDTTFFNHDFWTNDHTLQQHFYPASRPFAVLFPSGEKPWAIGEWAWAVYEHEDPANAGKPLTDVTKSQTLFNALYDDMRAQHVVGVCWWRGVMPNKTDVQYSAMGNTITTVNDYDTHDTRRKMLALHLDRSATVKPPW